MARHDEPVHAAGAVVWRTGPDGTEVLIVHRPRYDDWSFPKGKLEPGETYDDGARREVEEETGCDVELGPAVADCHYVDHRGRPKVVRYFLAVAIGGAFMPNDEVDEARWVPFGRVSSMLSYSRDVEVAEQARRLAGAADDGSGTPSTS